jgi:DNA helicase HerA-like ATPase
MTEQHEENGQEAVVVSQVNTHNFEAGESTLLPAGAVTIGEIAHHDGTPNFTGISVLLAAEHDVLPGQFLLAWHGKRQPTKFTVIQVNDCTEVNPNEAPELSVARSRLGLSKSYADEGVSTRIYRLALCETIEELTVNSADWSVASTSAPQTLPRAGDPVILMPPNIVATTIGGLSDEGDGLAVGATFGAEKIPVVLRAQVFQMGAFVAGNPGKGKSYFGGVLVEEAHAWGIPTLVLDVNGEMVETAKSLGGLAIHLPDPGKFGLTLNLLTPPELISITPGVHEGTGYADLIELAHEQLRSEAKTGTIPFSALLQRIQKLGDDLKMTAVQVRAAVSRISKLQNDPLIGSDFDFIANLKKHKIVVLDCRHLSLRQTQLIAAAAARVLQAHGREMTRKANETGDAEAASWFAIFFADEAHMVAPNDQGVVSTQVIYELARMGRHVRTGLIMSSQSPSDLDPSVLKRLQTRFVFALEKDQLRAISGVNADLNPRILDQLPKLPKGVCAVSGSSEIINHGFLLRVRERKTPVGGSTPKVFEGRKKKSAK